MKNRRSQFVLVFWMSNAEKWGTMAQRKTIVDVGLLDVWFQNDVKCWKVRGDDATKIFFLIQFEFSSSDKEIEEKVKKIENGLDVDVSHYQDSKIGMKTQKNRFFVY